MDQLLALLYIVTCVILILRMVFGRTVLDCHLGVLGAFSLGYYPLPVLFKSLSNLDYYREDTIFAALSIHYLFLVFLIIGAITGRRLVLLKAPLVLPAMDSVFRDYRLPLSLAAFAIYLTYFSTQRLTSYSADDFEAFFQDRGPFFAIIAMLGHMSLAYLAVSLAACWKAGDRLGLLVTGSMFAFCVAITVTLGQRLIIISPIFILLASLYASGQRRRAMRLLAVGVAVLLLVSPLAVYIRSTSYERQGTGESALQNFKYEGGLVESSFRSIVDRADLIYVTIAMKPYIDAAPAPGFIYYLSVLLIPIPRLIIPDKPYLLSVDGTVGGELSNWSWIVLNGGTGSLTAFGGLYAYREGGWVWLCINGMLTGLFYAFLARWLGGGGFVGRFFYALLFVDLAVAKVPPSLFEALAAVLGVFPFVLVPIILSFVWKHLPRRRPYPVRRVAPDMATPRPE